MLRHTELLVVIDELWSIRSRESAMKPLDSESGHSLGECWCYSLWKYEATGLLEDPSFG